MPSLGMEGWLESNKLGHVPFSRSDDLNIIIILIIMDPQMIKICFVISSNLHLEPVGMLTWDLKFFNFNSLLNFILDFKLHFIKFQDINEFLKI